MEKENATQTTNQPLEPNQKRCIKCGNILDKTAKKCDKCFKYQIDTKHIIIGIIACFFLFGMIGAVIGEDEATKTDKNVETHTELKDVKELYYLDLHEKNAEYIDKNVKFSAKISSVETDSLSITEGIGGVTGMISVEPIDTDKLSQLKENDYVTVVGHVTDKALGILYIKEAQILQTGKDAQKSLNTQKKKSDEQKKAQAAKDAKQKKKQEAASKKQAKLDKASYIKSCKEYPYKDLARYPDKYKGKKIKIVLRVEQIVEGGLFDDTRYYRCYSKTPDMDIWYENEYFIVDYRNGDSTKILEEDILTLYGEYNGVEKVERALTGTSDEVPTINMKYCNIK